MMMEDNCSLTVSQQVYILSFGGYLSLLPLDVVHGVTLVGGDDEGP